MKASTLFVVHAVLSVLVTLVLGIVWNDDNFANRTAKRLLLCLSAFGVACLFVYVEG